MAAQSAGYFYTSVTLVPPANWTLGPVYIGNSNTSANNPVVANSSGQYVFSSATTQIDNGKLASMLSQGWNIVSLTQ